MRQDCKHFESRTYPNGETVRKCDLDLAPEAPWRCPADCPKFQRRLADVNWSHGTLVTPPTPDEPFDAASPDDFSGNTRDASEEIDAIGSATKLNHLIGMLKSARIELCDHKTELPESPENSFGILFRGHDQQVQIIGEPRIAVKRYRMPSNTDELNFPREE